MGPRGRRYGLAAFSVLVSAVVVLSGAASAAGLRTVSAPYHGSTYSAADTLTPFFPGPCGHAEFTQPIQWLGSHGTAGWSERAKAEGGPACTGANQSTALPSATATLTVGIPIGRVATNGTYTVLANWTVDYAATWTTSHVGCPTVNLSGSGKQTCEVEAGFEIALAGPPELIDLATGAVQYGAGRLLVVNGTEWSESAQCAVTSGRSFTCTNTTSANLPHRADVNVSLDHTVYWNQTTLVANDPYGLEFVLSGDAYAYVESGPASWTASAEASVDLGAHGHDFTLDSVEIL